MPIHQEQRTLPYSPEQVFAIVADVATYPEFLPWCSAARISDTQEDRFKAELLIAFKGLRQSYTSRVVLSPYESIEVEYLDGPFHHLTNRWRFYEDPAGCRVDFYIDFGFKARFLNGLLENLFDKAVHKMVSAFIARAEAVYGKG